MPTVNSVDYYSEKAADAVRSVYPRSDSVTGPDVYAKVFHENAVNHKGNQFIDSVTADNINAHLSGVFSAMTGKKGMTLDNVTVEDVRAIADRFSVGGERYEIRGNDIREDNYKSVLGEIALLTSMGLSGDERAKSVGFLDENHEALMMKLDAFELRTPEEVTVPKKPNIFKRIMNKLFGAYDYDCRAYKNALAAREEYDQQKAKVDKYNEALDKRFDDNYEASVGLQDTYEKQVNVRENAQQAVNANEANVKQPGKVELTQDIIDKLEALKTPEEKDIKEQIDFDKLNKNIANTKENNAVNDVMDKLEQLQEQMVDNKSEATNERTSYGELNDQATKLTQSVEPNDNLEKLNEMK